MLELKEFYQLKYNFGPKMPINRFQLYTQQLFVARWMASSGRMRCFLKHSMGSGKTISSLHAAAENHQLYKFLGEGRVIIVGFQKDTFIREILTKPELGYISHEEFAKLKELERNTSEIGAENYKRYRSYLKRRIVDTSQDGYIKFIGYRELHNLIFPKPSEEILKIFENAFVICDEIHNVYNSLETNSYGRALQFLLDKYPTTMKVLFMSGTPINNKPSEIVDILNLVIPGGSFKASDFFSDGPRRQHAGQNDGDGASEKLLPGALEKIGLLSEGYFSFFINEDISFMPQKKIEGEVSGQMGMKFVRCEYSPEHSKLVNSLASIGLDDHNIFDAYFPLEDRLFYKNSDFALLNSASDSWKQKMGIFYLNGTCTGNILLRENIQKYSSKYFHMLGNLFNDGKILIYHEYINGTGLKLIEQILVVNGILSQNGIITRNTRCAKCYKTHHEHDDPHSETSDRKSSCIFAPLRFLMMYGEMDKKNVDKNMSLFNSPSNAEGWEYKYLLGSSMIREGYDFKCVREIWVMHVLPHISAYLQLEGRAIRAFSHEILPLEKRNVTIRIFASDDEIKRYDAKIENYRVIQCIDKKINENAVDASLYYPIIKKSFVDGTFGVLKFPERVRVTKIDDRTYNIFYGDWEVEEIKKIIASLFILTPVWTLEKLMGAVRDPPFERVIDTSLFKEDSIILALGDLIYGYQHYPIVREGRGYRICCVHEKAPYYVLYPLKKPREYQFGKKLEFRFGVPQITFNNWIQPENANEGISVDITDDLFGLNTNYAEMRDKFIQRFHDASMLEIPVSTEVYGVQFHMKLMEEAIEYIFKILTKKTTREEHHEFFFKIIHFYSKLDLVIYANGVPEKYNEIYDKYSEGVSDTNTLLVSRCENSSSSSISSFEISEINKFLESNVRAPKNILPVGHFLAPEPKLYTPAGWFFAKSFSPTIADSVENDIIIGYYERSETAIEFKFKLRKPTHMIEIKADRREMETGMACESKHKKDLMAIGKQLSLQISGTNKNMCAAIKEYLLHMELKSRNRYRKGKTTKHIRWCYLPYE